MESAFLKLCVYLAVQMATQASSLQPEVDALIKQLDYTYMDIPELIEGDVLRNCPDESN